MNGLKSLIHEIHRRSLWQVLGIYIVSSWIVFQVAQTLTEGLGLPDWVPPVALILLLIGLPIVVATAFVQEGMGTQRGSDQIAETAQPGADIDSAAVDPAPVAERGSAPIDPGGTPRPASHSRSESRRGHHRLFTWRNALAGGALAFVVLALVTGGYLAMRTLGIGPAGTLVARGVLDERDRVLIAEFENRTTDSLLATTVTEALRVDLAQSQLIRLADPSFVAGALARMERPADTRVDRTLARELARREGIKAVVAGEIGQAGRGFILTSELIVPETGEVLVSVRETADDDGEVIAAVDELSKRLRERIGESLRTIRAEAPLERATTADFAALQRYTQALRAMDVEGEIDRGLALLEEAVTADTAFAMAWRKLGMQLWNMGEERERSIEAMTKAYDHRDRLTEVERYLATAAYHETVSGELDRAITAYENLLAIDPGNGWALNNMAVTYRELRQYERSEEAVARAVEADSSLLAIRNLAGAHYDLGKVQEAAATIELLARKFPDAPQVPEDRFWLASAEGDYEAADEHARALAERTAGSAFWAARVSGALAATAATQGRLRDALSHKEAEMAAEEGRGAGPRAVNAAIDVAGYELVRRRQAEALARIDDALARHPLEEMRSLERPYAQLAETYARAGRPARARELLAEHSTVTAGTPLPSQERADLARANAHVALAEGRHSEAIEGFRSADFSFCRGCALPGLAEAFDRAGQADSTIAVYERFVETRGIRRILGRQFFLGPTYERLGQLYDEQGDLENAARYYALFTELWAEADPELQPRVRAAQARLEEIVRERG